MQIYLLQAFIPQQFQKMGQKNSNTLNNNQNYNKYYLSESLLKQWISIDQPTDTLFPSINMYRTQLLFNTITNQYLEQYNLHFVSTQDFQDYQKNLEWRLSEQNKQDKQNRQNKQNKQNSDDCILFPTPRFFMDTSAVQLCSVLHSGSIYFNKIDIRLKEINDIPFLDALYMYEITIRAFDKLAHKYGYFKINEDMVFMDKQGHINVWVNPNLSLNFPNFYDHYEDRGKVRESKEIFNDLEQRQGQMVIDLLKMIEDNIDPDQYSHNNFMLFSEFVCQSLFRSGQSKTNNIHFLNDGKDSLFNPSTHNLSNALQNSRRKSDKLSPQTKSLQNIFNQLYDKIDLQPRLLNFRICYNLFMQYLQYLQSNVIIKKMLASTNTKQLQKAPKKYLKPGYISQPIIIPCRMQSVYQLYTQQRQQYADDSDIFLADKVDNIQQQPKNMDKNMDKNMNRNMNKNIKIKDSNDDKQQTKSRNSYYNSNNNNIVHKFNYYANNQSYRKCDGLERSINLRDNQSQGNLGVRDKVGVKTNKQMDRSRHERQWDSNLPKVKVKNTFERNNDEHKSRRINTEYQINNNTYNIHQYDQFGQNNLKISRNYSRKGKSVNKVSFPQKRVHDNRISHPYHPNIHRNQENRTDKSENCENNYFNDQFVIQTTRKKFYTKPSTPLLRTQNSRFIHPKAQNCTQNIHNNKVNKEHNALYMIPPQHMTVDIPYISHQNPIHNKIQPAYVQYSRNNQHNKNSNNNNNNNNSNNNNNNSNKKQRHRKNNTVFDGTDPNIIHHTQQINQIRNSLQEFVLPTHRYNLQTQPKLITRFTSQEHKLNNNNHCYGHPQNEKQKRQTHHISHNSQKQAINSNTVTQRIHNSYRADNLSDKKLSNTVQTKINFVFKNNNQHPRNKSINKQQQERYNKNSDNNNKLYKQISPKNNKQAALHLNIINMKAKQEIIKPHILNVQKNNKYVKNVSNLKYYTSNQSYELDHEIADDLEKMLADTSANSRNL